MSTISQIRFTPRGLMAFNTSKLLGTFMLRTMAVTLGLVALFATNSASAADKIRISMVP